MLNATIVFCPYLCPVSWARVNAVLKPVFSLIVQLLDGEHIPPTGANPVMIIIQSITVSTVYSRVLTNNPSRAATASIAT